jgi:hypothetical protein
MSLPERTEGLWSTLHQKCCCSRVATSTLPGCMLDENQFNWEPKDIKRSLLDTNRVNTSHFVPYDIIVIYGQVMCAFRKLNSRKVIKTRVLVCLTESLERKVKVIFSDLMGLIAFPSSTDTQYLLWVIISPSSIMIQSVLFPYSLV